MLSVSTPQWGSIEQYAGLAFVVAAVGGFGNVTVHHFGSAIGIPASDIVLDSTILLTYSGAVFGLLGVYTLTVDRAPRLSRLGVLLVGLTSGSIVASLVGKYLVTIGDPQSIKLLLSLSFYACSTLSFLVFGIVSLRTRVPSRTVGYLLLTVVVSRAAIVAGQVELGAVLFVLPMLGVGYLLRRTTTRSTAGVSADETTA
jgi:hypothetical protein